MTSEKMSRKLFVDSNVFVAVFNRDDSLHQKAVEVWEAIPREGTAIYTSNLVLSEVLTVLRLRAGKRASLEFGKMALRESRVLSILYLNQPLTLAAFRIFSRVPDKDFSFVDASIVTLAQQFGLQVLTFDKRLEKRLRLT